MKWREGLAILGILVGVILGVAGAYYGMKWLVFHEPFLGAIFGVIFILLFCSATT